MERLFIYVFIGLVLLAGLLFWILKKLVVDKDEQEMNFGAGAIDSSDMEYVCPAPREHVAYQDRQSSIMISAIKKAPKTILTAMFIQLFLMVFTGYLSVKNIERLAMAGSAITQGDYGMAITALWPNGKEAVIEQYRVARGTNPYLVEKGLTNFAYIGQLEGKSVAIMQRLYSTQDHDEDLKESDEAYGQVIIGLSAGKAKDVCDDKYNGNVISILEWGLSRGHFLAARNVKEYPDIPEWTRDFSNKDTDDFLVIAKDSNVVEYAEKEDLDREEGGYIDGDDLSIAGFRCSITW